MKENMGEPTFNQVLLALKSQVIVGKTYLIVADGLLQSQQDDPVILQTAQVFFGLMINGSLEHAQMSIARLYDVTPGSVTVPRMLEQAKRSTDSFVRGDRQQIADLIAKGEQVVIGLEPVLKAIRMRRNTRLAHLDPRSVADPNAFSEDARLTFPDLRRAFKETEDLLIDICSLHDGTIGDLRFVGGDDYKTVLNNLRRYKCGYIREYERLHGTGSWTSERPKDCSGAAYDLI
jgi:hypothetical protein